MNDKQEGEAELDLEDLDKRGYLLIPQQEEEFRDW